MNAVDGLSNEPASYKEAMSRPDSEQWRPAVDVELQALQEKGVYRKVEQVPQGKKALPSKLILTIKRDALGNIDKYKMRLVALGCRQVAGRDYDEVHSPTAQQATFRILFAKAAPEGLDVDQIDVKTAFLNGALDQEIYIRLPAQLGGEIWRPEKALYGLKQAARAWHKQLRDDLMNKGFTSSAHDPCLFFRGQGVDRVYVLFHDDAGILVGSTAQVSGAKKDIGTCFEINHLGAAHYFLSLEVSRDNAGSISVSQEKYARTCWRGSRCRTASQSLRRWNCVRDCRVQTARGLRTVWCTGNWWVRLCILHATPGPILHMPRAC